ncbi:NUDIX hydrolase [Ramlibacter albus]|uniref:NUDIX domain-containing protein n=1 Tax=Ramlibacter albus TaxID=2079448 RepID=A0A923S7S6_9BURK|nr:NUDIX domain-containing protein [Ramlibacter albus]MBC5767392.1 NUDIX domain-containing protein [Ramlibacter albus]
MEPHGDPLNMPALPSATVVMLRDGGAGLEVFLLKRHGLSDVLGGAYVFPGGKLDREDVELVDRLDTAPQQLHDALGEPGLQAEEASGLFVAAMREAFEETGVLFADVDAARAETAWRSLREGFHFADVVENLDLRLLASCIAPWSRWITPVVGGVVRKRFDTRFFVAAVPEGQQPRHDNHEATESTWLSPRVALQQYWDGEIQLAPPQIMSLAQLARHADVASVLAGARSRKPPTIQPEPIETGDGVRVICYPGDERHSVRERALLGPTRLAWRNKRFEPDGGFDALFS